MAQGECRGRAGPGTPVQESVSGLRSRLGAADSAGEASVTLVQLQPFGQLSRLGEAVSAGDRRVLKRRRLQEEPGLEQPCSPGALDAIAACRGVEVASAVAVWPPGPRELVGCRGSSSSGPPGPCSL